MGWFSRNTSENSRNNANLFISASVECPSSVEAIAAVIERERRENRINVSVIKEGSGMKPKDMQRIMTAAKKAHKINLPPDKQPEVDLELTSRIVRHSFERSAQLTNLTDSQLAQIYGPLYESLIINKSPDTATGEYPLVCEVARLISEANSQKVSKNRISVLLGTFLNWANKRF